MYTHGDHVFCDTVINFYAGKIIVSIFLDSMAL